MHLNSYIWRSVERDIYKLKKKEVCRTPDAI